MNRDGTRMRKDQDLGLERAGQVEAGTSSYHGREGYGG